MDISDIRARIPGIPDGATRDFDVSASGMLSSANRKVMRYLMKAAMPGVPFEVYADVRTLGDVEDILKAHGEHSSAPQLDESAFVASSVFMRPVMSQDFEQLYFSALEPSNSYRWRFRGQTVSFREFSESLSVGALAQFSFASTSTNRLVAFCSAYNYDSVARHCTFAVQRLDFDSAYDTAIIESVALFLNYLFRTFNLRKVFADLPEYNYSYFGAVEGVFEREADKRDYYWHANRYWSEITISTTREAWTQFAGMFFDTAE